MGKIRIPAKTFKRGGKLIHRKGYLKEDTGKPGRTPKGKRWSKGIEVPETGWEKDMPTEERRTLVLEAFDGDALKAARYMQYLVNLSADPEVDRKAKADAEYFFRMHQREG